MKKISAVLLVLVLVGSVAFAGFTGYAQTGIGYNFDTTAYGFIKKGTGATIDVTLNEFVGEAKGEGDIYADIRVVLDFTYSNADDGDVSLPSPTGEVQSVDVGLSFKHAKIVGTNWYVGILNAVRAPNFATSAIDSKDLTRANNDLGFAYDDGTYYADLMARNYFDRGNGIEVGYNDYVIGFTLDGNGDAGTYKVFGSLKTPEYALADGLKVQLGAAGFAEQTVGSTGVDEAASANAKVSYANDLYSASGAVDFVYDDGPHADVALKAAYDIVSLDAYYATEEMYFNTDDSNFTVTGADNLLSAKVAVDLDPMTITFTGKDLVNTQNLSASLKYVVSDELSVTGRGGYKFSTEIWNMGADVDYATSDYTAKVGGTYYSDEVIKLNASVESTTIIPGATLKVAYAGDDLKEVTPALGDNGDKGSVYAMVKIAF